MPGHAASLRMMQDHLGSWNRVTPVEWETSPRETSHAYPEVAKPEYKEVSRCELDSACPEPAGDAGNFWITRPATPICAFTVA